MHYRVKNPMKKNLKPFELFLAVGLVGSLTACSLTTTREGGEDGERIISEQLNGGEGGEGVEGVEGCSHSP